MEPPFRVFVPFLLLSASVAAIGQTSTEELPCNFHGELLRTAEGKIHKFTSAEMKGRATWKVELGGLLRNADFKGTAVVDVLVGLSGEVVCLKSRPAHPLIRFGVEEALKWKFKPVEIDGRPIAYLGQLQFTLCNISCGARGASMTLLK